MEKPDRRDRDVPGPAVDRWARMVRARRDQLAARAVGDRGPGYLERVRSFATDGPDAVDEAFLGTVRRDVGPHSTVLDVGAGAGRHAVPLAEVAARVVAVEPNPALLAMLLRRAVAAGLDGVITPVLRRWEDCDDLHADVAVCARVLPTVVNVGPFVQRLSRAAATSVHVLLPAPVERGEEPGRGGDGGVARPDADDLAAVVEEVVGVPCTAVALDEGIHAATAVSWAGDGGH